MFNPNPRFDGFDEGDFQIEEEEHEFTCPYCWQLITMLLDMTVREQTYIEDCENCCNPIEITYGADADGFLTHFHAEALE